MKKTKIGKTKKSFVRPKTKAARRPRPKAQKKAGKCTASAMACEDFDKTVENFIRSREGEEAGNGTAETAQTMTATEKFDSLTGLDEVKSRVRKLMSLVRFDMLRRKAGMPSVSVPLHTMLVGGPGTGKTTVARLLGQMLHEAGVLSKGHVVMCERSTLLGQYYHTESESTLEAIKEAEGGILFIDEAYQLYQPQDPRDPGRFVIETLLTVLADEEQRDWMLVMAGYTEPMMQMFRMNPGLRSRIPEANILHFHDFTEKQLITIADNYFHQHGLRIGSRAHGCLVKTISHAWRHRDENFGNARYITTLIEADIIPEMARRIEAIAAPTRKNLSEVLPCDIPVPQLPEKSDKPGIPPVKAEKRRTIGFYQP